MLELRSSSMSIIFRSFKIDAEKATSYFIMAEVIPGVFSAMVVGYILNRSKRFKTVLCICCFLTSACYVMNTFIPYLGSLNWIIVGAAINACAVGPELSTVQEFLCELGYPAGESMIIGIIRFAVPVLHILGQLTIRNSQ